MGLWLVQECRRAWLRDGEAPDYADLAALAAAAPSGSLFGFLNGFGGDGHLEQALDAVTFLGLDLDPSGLGIGLGLEPSDLGFDLEPSGLGLDLEDLILVLISSRPRPRPVKKQD